MTGDNNTLDWLVEDLLKSGDAASPEKLNPDTALLEHAVALLEDFERFCASASQLRLRRYQRDAAEAVLHSVRHGLGQTIVVMFPRQSGKNELQAQLECYLLARLSQQDAEIVKVSPTWKPQSLNAMRRLQRVLEQNRLVNKGWIKESGYCYRVGRARVFFLSGAPEANIVGATASTLLEVDEAQDVQIAKFDRDILPMAASTNATRVFWGTAWTSHTLLARELRAAQAAEAGDGQRRVFVLTANQVSDEVPAYGDFVAEQVRKMGRSHPMVKTQYFSEEIDAEGGLFSAERLALMQGIHPPALQPVGGRLYAFLLDVAGEDETPTDPGAPSGGAGRDATALTIVEIDRHSADPFITAPRYRVCTRRQWTGVKHSRLYSVLLGLAEDWRPETVVVDATGVGAGLASFLDKALPGRVQPFIFSAASKSKLGWDFLALIDSGRWQEPAFALQDGAPEAHLQPEYALQAVFFKQAQGCQYRVLEGPGKLLRWGVPDGSRDPSDGTLLHDDLLISAALCAVLDEQDWRSGEPAVIIPAPDPLQDIERHF